MLEKSRVLGTRDVILSLHRVPENNFTPEQTREAFRATLRSLSAKAAKLGLTLHLRTDPEKTPGGMSELKRLIDQVGADHLKIAASTALLARDRAPGDLGSWKDRLGLWLVAAPGGDSAGDFHDLHAPLHGSPAFDDVACWVEAAPETPVVSDAILADPDQEYLEARALDRLRTSRDRPGRRP